MDAGLGERLINNYRSSNISVGNSFEKISTGNRINSASDDPAGLSISEKMISQIKGLEQGMKNVQDGISMIQVAEGSLGKISDMTNRLNELAIQSANGILSDSDRAILQKEADEIIDEISKIIEETSFNTKPLFNKQDNNINIQFGPDANNSQAIEMPYLTLKDLGLDNFDLSTQKGAQNAIKSLEETSDLINTHRAKMGAYTNRFESKLDNLSNYQKNIITANSRIRDVDIAKEMIELSRKKLMEESSAMILSMYKGQISQNAKFLLQ